jgi:Tfp pilus assembly PilM family ATPase
MNLLGLLYPKEKIGGLEIRDDKIRYLFLNKNGNNFNIACQESIKLDKNIIKDGIVKDKKGLIKALKELRRKVQTKIKSPYIILTIQSANIFSQASKFPLISDEEIDSAIELNIGFASPFPAGEIYYDWQDIKTSETGSREVLLSLATKNIINSYIEALRASGFMPFAIENSALSLSFICNNFAGKNGLIANVGEFGADIILIKSGTLKFSRSMNWNDFLGKEDKKTAKNEISLEAIKDYLKAEIFKAINYFEAEENVKIDEIVFLAPAKWKNGLAKHLSSLGVKILNLEPVNKINPKDIEKIDDSWWPIFGAAARGIIPRSEDDYISFMPVGTEEAYNQKKLISYTSLLSKVFITVFIAFTAIFAGTAIFFSYTKVNLEKQITLLGRQPQLPELETLEKQAIKFNSDVALIAKAQTNITDWAPIVKIIMSQVTPGITITLISASSLDNPINITAIAASRDGALFFKKKIESDPHFKDVILPVTSFVQSENIVFSVSLKYNK